MLATATRSSAAHPDLPTRARSIFDGLLASVRDADASDRDLAFVNSHGLSTRRRESIAGQCREPWRWLWRRAQCLAATEASQVAPRAWRLHDLGACFEVYLHESGPYASIDCETNKC
jgi:hypothetical protein